MGATCQTILQAVQERAPRDFEREVLDFIERPARRGNNSKPIKRKVETFRSGKKFKVGSLEIHPIHVDHSIPGAYGFIIYTSSGPVVYTGDIRLHGTKPEMTEEFVEEARRCKPAVLICEGTRIVEPPINESEPRVYQTASELVRAHKNAPVFADFNFKDVDRVRTFYRIAKKSGRKFVVKLKDCYYLKDLSKDPNLGVPAPDDKDIVIYKPNQASGTFANVDYYGEDATEQDLAEAGNNFYYDDGPAPTLDFQAIQDCLAEFDKPRSIDAIERKYGYGSTEYIRAYRNPENWIRCAFARYIFSI